MGSSWLTPDTNYRISYIEEMKEIKKKRLNFFCDTDSKIMRAKKKYLMYVPQNFDYE